MTEVKASLKYFRASPRKVREVAGLIRGKSVPDAWRLLKFLPKRSALAWSKLLASAKANARHNCGLDPENMLIKEVKVDAGPTLKRFMPRAFGRAFPVRKRTSHLIMVLAERK